MRKCIFIKSNTPNESFIVIPILLREIRSHRREYHWQRKRLEKLRTTGAEGNEESFEL